MSETKVNLGLGGLRPEVVPGAKERDRASDPRTRQKRQRMRAILLPLSAVFAFFAARSTDAWDGHRRVRAHPPTVFDLAPACLEDHSFVDGLPRLGTNRPDVGLQGGLLRRRGRRREPTESAQLKRVLQMKCQLFVAEAEHLLDDPDPHDLLGRKS